ncbi:MAG TPA: shikimate dehydrogenase [Caulobacteraceae bacterium]|jgi:shikimate dehydrogenase|nr:shikimate dehydrogenase [Caulobacteraceae bacterium]
MITGATMVAGVAGAPVRHSLSPQIHNAWLAAARIDGVYVAFAPPAEGFEALARGLRGGAIRGLNVTAPFKQQALALADVASRRASRAGAANLLVFDASGAIHADNTDGVGLLSALAEQAPALDLALAPTAILGAGGAARGAAAALIEAGAAQVRILARTAARGEQIAAALGERVRVVAPADWAGALADCGLLVNATPAGLAGGEAAVDVSALPPGAVVMDMVYAPLTTPLLAAARGRGLTTVDGLAMLIGQARPSFEAFFGAPAPDIDLRGALIASGAVEAGA